MKWLLSPGYRLYSPRWFTWRLAWGLATCLAVTIMYFPASHFTLARSHELLTRVDAAIPFVPWTWWIYFPGYLAGLALAILGVRDDRLFFRALVMVALAQAISATVYLLVPSTFPRPSAADLTGYDLTRRAVLWFWTVDPPNNTFPSTHVAISTVAALTMWRDRHPLKWLAVAFTVGVFVTVHTAKQHYWIDAVVGVMVGLGAYRSVLRLWPLGHGPGLDGETGRGEIGAPDGSSQDSILHDADATSRHGSHA
jgi:hypothetical protein